MSERDDELLKRYRGLPREAPPASIDASILAASRRATRRPLARWAAPFSVAAVLVLALGLVLKVQREAPEATLPSSPQDQAVPGTNAPAAGAASTEMAKGKDVQAPAVVQQQDAVPPPKTEKKALAKPKRESPFAPEPPARAAPAPSAADVAPAEHHDAPAADALVRSNAAPAPAAAPAPQQSTIATATAPAPPAARAQSSARMAAAPAAVAKEAAAPEQRELERIARLRADGKDDEADAALEAFRRAHPDYRIDPAMWEKVRRR